MFDAVPLQQGQFCACVSGSAIYWIKYHSVGELG
jgi:hypothetical protein